MTSADLEACLGYKLLFSVVSDQLYCCGQDIGIHSLLRLWVPLSSIMRENVHRQTVLATRSDYWFVAGDRAVVRGRQQLQRQAGIGLEGENFEFVNREVRWFAAQV